MIKALVMLLMTMFSTSVAIAWTPGTPTFHGPGKLKKATGLEYKNQSSTYEYEGNEFSHSYNSFAAHRVDLLDDFLISFSIAALTNGALDFEGSDTEFLNMIGLGTSFGMSYLVNVAEDIRLLPGFSLQGTLEKYSEGSNSIEFFTRDYAVNLAASYDGLGKFVPYAAMEGGRLEGKINSEFESNKFVAQTTSASVISAQIGTMVQFTKVTISLAATVGAQQGIIFNFYSTPENWDDADLNGE